MRAVSWMGQVPVLVVHEVLRMCCVDDGGNDMPTCTAAQYPGINRKYSMYVGSGDTQVVRLVHSKKNVSLRFKANGKGRSLIMIFKFMHRATQ
jgi:hypothetical protein